MPEGPWRALFITERSAAHQRNLLSAAPSELDVVALRSPTRSELLANLAGAHFLISERRGEIDAALLDAAPRLRMIIRLGSLSHDIDLEAARARSVVVARVPQRGAGLVAEHVMLQMLALLRRLRETTGVTLSDATWAPARLTDEDTFSYNWSGRENIDGLAGKTVGILGFGEVGAELARRLAGWDCRVLYHRRQTLPKAVEVELRIASTDLDALLATSDVVVNLLPYSAETVMLLNLRRLSQMTAGALVVSSGSGGVIDENALAGLYLAGHLGGVALDTYEWEPLQPQNPLRRIALEQPQANILLTPHVAAGASRERGQGRRAEYEPIMQFLRGDLVNGRLA